MTKPNTPDTRLQEQLNVIMTEAWSCLYEAGYLRTREDFLGWLRNNLEALCQEIAREARLDELERLPDDPDERPGYVFDRLRELDPDSAEEYEAQKAKRVQYWKETIEWASNKPNTTHKPAREAS